MLRDDHLRQAEAAVAEASDSLRRASAVPRARERAAPEAAGGEPYRAREREVHLLGRRAGFLVEREADLDRRVDAVRVGPAGGRVDAPDELRDRRRGDVLGGGGE